MEKPLLNFDYEQEKYDDYLTCKCCKNKVHDLFMTKIKNEWICDECYEEGIDKKCSK